MARVDKALKQATAAAVWLNGKLDKDAELERAERLKLFGMVSANLILTRDAKATTKSNKWIRMQMGALKLDGIIPVQRWASYMESIGVLAASVGATYQGRWELAGALVAKWITEMKEWKDDKA